MHWTLAPILALFLLVSHSFAQSAVAPDPLPATRIAAHVAGGTAEPVALESPLTAAPMPPVTEAMIEQEIAALQTAIDGATDLTEDAKADAVARWTEPKNGSRKRQLVSKRQLLEKEIAAAPTRLEELREQLTGAVELPTPDVPKDATVALLESRLDEIRQSVDTANAAATAAQEATENRARAWLSYPKKLRRSKNGLPMPSRQWLPRPVPKFRRDRIAWSNRPTCSR